jgi:hypothetical protein
MLANNGYFLEEEGLCNLGGTETEQDEARMAIDQAMKDAVRQQALNHIDTIKHNWALFSPAAQAVLDAYSKYVSEWLKASKTDKPSLHYHASGMAAALRAAADQVAPSDAMEPRNNISMAIECQRIRAELLAIADELEGQALSASITADQDLATACREWIKGCTCAARGTPQECEECTDGFLQAVLHRARRHGLEIGANSLEALPND